MGVGGVWLPKPSPLHQPQSAAVQSGMLGEPQAAWRNIPLGPGLVGTPSQALAGSLHMTKSLPRGSIAINSSKSWMCFQICAHHNMSQKAATLVLPFSSLPSFPPPHIISIILLSLPHILCQAPLLLQSYSHTAFLSCCSVTHPLILQHLLDLSSSLGAAIVGLFHIDPFFSLKLFCIVGKKHNKSLQLTQQPGSGTPCPHNHPLPLHDIIVLVTASQEILHINMLC